MEKPEAKPEGCKPMFENARPAHRAFGRSFKKVTSCRRSSAPADALVQRILQPIVETRPGEARALFWSWLYDFALFLAYYVFRPIRDERGVAGGVSNLPWLFTGTLL